MTRYRRLRPALMAGAGLLVIAALVHPEVTRPALAQNTPAPATAAASAPAATADAFTREELQQLLAPFALYPDDLLAQLLPACAYPIEIVQASRWLDKNKAAVTKGDFTGLDGQSWDPSVKALARFPDVIAKLNDDLDATTDIGDAFVNQPDDVAAVIQTLRAQAQKSGALKTTPQQRVSVEDQGGTNYIVIEPAEPGVIYVPTYDPAVVYYDNGSAAAAGLIGFGVGVAVGVAIDNAWDWGRGWVYPPRWPGYPGYRPGYPGYRPGYPGYRPGNDVNINIGNDINIGNGNTRPWRPDPDRYHPGQGSKPGLGKPGPGGPGDRPIAGDRPGIGSGGGPATGDRPGIGSGGGARPDRPDIAKPGTTQRPGADRPAASAKPSPAGPASKPAAKPQKPATQRPAPSRPARDTAFSDVRSGGASHNFAQRGGASRQSVSRPPVSRGGGGGRGGGHGGGRGR